MGDDVSWQTDVFVKNKIHQLQFPKVSQEVHILSFPGSVYFPREHDRHAITEAGTEHCYTCHSHQEKMSW